MITFSQEPSGISPAYNDTYIIFNSNLNDDTAYIRAGGNEFMIFPDLTGTYYFNLKKVVQTLINQNKFRDNTDTSLPNLWGFPDDSLYLSIDVIIIVKGDGVEESITRTYEFNKAVLQPGVNENNNDYALLSANNGGNSYNVTYFEGYPFDLTLKKVEKSNGTTNPDDSITYDNEITIRNINSGQFSPALRPEKLGAYRLVLDKGVRNMTSSGFLPMHDLLNKLDIRKDGVTKTSLNVKKVNNKCGVYLKWFNTEGGYSYWLFDEFFRESTKTTEGDFIGSNQFDLIYDNNVGNLMSTAKFGAKNMQLKTGADKNEVEQIRSLFMSPHVQLWTSQEAYVEGRWIDVSVTSNNFNYANKKAKNEVVVSIELPVLNSQTL